MSFWNYRYRFSKTNHHSRLGEAAETTITKLPGKNEVFEIKEITATLLEIPQLLSELQPKVFAETPFFKMLTKDKRQKTHLAEQLTEIKKALDRCCELALKQPPPKKQ